MQAAALKTFFGIRPPLPTSGDYHRLQRTFEQFLLLFATFRYLKAATINKKCERAHTHAAKRQPQIFERSIHSNIQFH
jgi:hypothetical protein